MTKLLVPEIISPDGEPTVHWFKTPGDWIDVKEPICEFVSASASFTVASAVAGTLAEYAADEGDEIHFGEVFAIVEAGDTVAPAFLPAEIVKVVTKSIEYGLARGELKRQSQRRLAVVGAVSIIGFAIAMGGLIGHFLVDGPVPTLVAGMAMLFVTLSLWYGQHQIEQ